MKCKSFTYCRILILLAFLSLAVSCGPSSYLLDVEMRYPSKSGVDLSGKIVSVICDASSDDNRSMEIADSFVSAIRNEYGHSVDSVSLFTVDTPSLYTSKDSLVNLVIETGADVVFLLDSVSGTGEDATVSLKCYDGMDKEDKVLNYNGLSTLMPSLFTPQWRREQYTILFYEGDQWISALVEADSYDWTEAIKYWIKLADTNNEARRSCAAYNIATACYMLGYYDLALKWLDMSDKGSKLNLSAGLRKRINARK